MGRIGNIALPAVLLALAVGAAADERSPQFTTIDFPGSVATTAFGVNERGEIVGSYRDSSNQTHGFVKAGDLFRAINYPGAVFTDARGISPAGEIVGSAITTLPSPRDVRASSWSPRMDGRGS